MSTDMLLQSMSGLSMGSEPPKFAKLDDRYKCEICKNVLHIPMMTQCGHRMCRSCSTDYLQQYEGSAKCPVNLDDCITFTQDTIFPDFGTYRDLQKLQVYCPNNRHGCRDLIPWSKLIEHEATCKYALEDCINKGFGCRAKISKAKMSEHLQKDCEFKTKQCPHCEVRILEKMLEEHINNACPAVSIICPFKCGEQSIQRGELHDHKKVCQAKPKDCRYKDVGCTYMGSEDEVRAHEANDSALHVDFLHNRVIDLELENAKLRNSVQDFQQRSSSGESGPISNEVNKRCDLLEARQTKQENSIKSAQKLVATINERMEISSGNVTTQDLATVRDTLRNLERRIDTMKQSDSHSVPDEARQQIIAMERTLGLCNMRLQEMDLRLQCVETASFNGILIWKIRDFARRKQEAVSGKTVSLYSQPFYTSRYGYKACARIYLNGDGMGKTTHMSLFFVILRGDFDALLPWPFRQKVSMTLIDQEGGKKNIVDSFRADPTSNSFKRPTSDMNIASGCPLFAPQSTIENAPFLKDDCIFLKIQVETTELKDASYDPKSGSFG